MADSKIRVLIDVVTDKASSSLKSFRQDLASSEGAMGKLRTTGSAAFNTIKQNAAQMAVAAGGALVAFATKAVGDFQNLALEAGKFADATGIAVEDASRWIEVAGDLGIEASKVETAIMRMNKSIADGKMDDFSDQIVRAADGTVDANATFQNLITTIGAIRDPTERAKVAQEAFGRSYGEVAELMEMSATDLASALGNVSDSKVIDDDELRKARDFRAAMDELSDKVGDLALKLGEALIPKILEVIEIAEGIGDIAAPLLGAGEAADDVADDVAKLNREYDALYDQFLTSSPGVQSLIERMGELGLVTNETAEESEAAAEELEDMAASADRTANRIDALKNSVDRLRGAMSDRAAYESAVDGWNKVLWAATAATNAEQAGSADAAQLREEANAAVRESISATLDYIATVGGIPSEQTTEIEALIDQGRYNEVESMLQQLARRRTATIEALGTYLGRERRASGGPVSSGRSYLVGEQGPEVVTMGGNGYVTPNHALRGGGMGGGTTNNITINMPPGSDGEDVVRALKRWQQRNGAIPIATR